MTRFHCKPGGSIGGEIRVPGDKSISHRSIMLSAIADGSSHIDGFLCGEDSLNTMRAFRLMGVDIEQNNEQVVVHGVGNTGLQAPEKDLDLGNSGTAMRLMLGLLVAQTFDCRLVGDESLSGRPMGRVIDPLSQMGAKIASDTGGKAPLRIEGGQKLQAIDYTIPVASAQVKSSILLAGLYASGETRIREPAPTRDHSERMLRSFGVSLSINGPEIRIPGQQSLCACDIDIPADISSAAFFIVAASIAPDSEICLQHVGVNPTRTGVIDILRLMGANIEITNNRIAGGEPVADIEVRYAPLQGIEIPEELVPLAIDEFPVLFVAAACAEGKTVLRGAEELRVKESDRIQVMAEGLSGLGIEVQTFEDGIEIEGGAMQGGIIDSHGDHRIAMAFSIAALRARNEICIENCSNVNTSFPGFVDLARQCGIRISNIDET